MLLAHQFIEHATLASPQKCVLVAGVYAVAPQPGTIDLDPNAIFLVQSGKCLATELHKGLGLVRSDQSRFCRHRLHCFGATCSWFELRPAGYMHCWRWPPARLLKLLLSKSSRELGKLQKRLNFFVDMPLQHSKTVK